MGQEVQELREFLNLFYYITAFATVILAFLWKPARERGISVGSILSIYIMFICCILIAIIAGILNFVFLCVFIFFIVILFGVWYTREKPGYADVLLMAIRGEWDRMAKRGVDQKEIQRLKNMSVADLAQEIEEYRSSLVVAIDFFREQAEIREIVEEACKNTSQKLFEHEEYYPGNEFTGEDEMWLDNPPDEKPISPEMLLANSLEKNLAKIRSASPLS